MDQESHAEEGLSSAVTETIVTAVTQPAVVPLAIHGTDELAVAALMSALRREGFDLRRRMFVAYVIDFGTQREGAQAAALLLRDTDWDTALYGDASGWVLRLSRICRVTRDTALTDMTEVRQLAARCRGLVRGVTVEDLLRDDDVWSELASRLESGRRRGDETAAESAAAVIPVQRRDASVRADR